MKSCAYCGKPVDTGDHPACKASRLAADLEWEQAHGDEQQRRMYETSPRPRTELEKRRAKATAATKPHRATIFARDGHKCTICGSVDRLVLDHITPIARGGSDSPENLQTLCWSCNSRKGAR